MMINRAESPRSIRTGGKSYMQGRRCKRPKIRRRSQTKRSFTQGPENRIFSSDAIQSEDSALSIPCALPFLSFSPVIQGPDLGPPRHFALLEIGADLIAWLSIDQNVDGNKRVGVKVGAERAAFVAWLIQSAPSNRKMGQRSVCVGRKSEEGSTELWASARVCHSVSSGWG